MRQSSIAGTIVSVGLVGFIVDRVLKRLALDGMTLGPLDGGIRFEFFQNPSVAFSIAIPNAVSLIVIPFVCVLFVYTAVKLYRSGELPRAALLMTAIVGAASNYLDRVQHGYVVDYLSIGNWFPVFNLGDAMIVVSLALALLPTRRKSEAQSH